MSIAEDTFDCSITNKEFQMSLVCHFLTVAMILFSNYAGAAELILDVGKSAVYCQSSYEGIDKAVNLLNQGLTSSPLFVRVASGSTYLSLQVDRPYEVSSPALVQGPSGYSTACVTITKK
jgi:hypothetical protein